MTTAPAAPAEPSGREMLRHTLATLAYRADKPLRDSTNDFAHFRAGDTTRTPSQIVVHMCDLMTWGHGMARGIVKWPDSSPSDWSADVERLFAEITKFEAYLASDEPLLTSAERLFQGPIADALTHVGQLTMLRRLAGVQIRGENYAKADIERGRVGREQAAPRVEFD